MADIFISYKREDRERIAPFARSLEARGYTVWWDLELVPSQKFERQIKRELDAAKCVIVVWTERSIADDGMYVSEWVQIEANSGDERGILLPVQLDAGRKHWRHGQNQFAALNGWTGDETAPGFQDLLKGVELQAGARVRPQDIELSAWQQAERTETADGFKRFLESYPQSRFADIARGRITELEEVAAWQALGAAPTIAALAAFLRRFPAGRFADDAEAKIRAMELAGARAATPPQWAASPRPPLRVQPEPPPQPSSPTLSLPKWLAPAGVVGLAIVASLVWPHWNRVEQPPVEPAATEVAQSVDEAPASAPSAVEPSPASSNVPENPRRGTGSDIPTSTSTSPPPSATNNDSFASEAQVSPPQVDLVPQESLAIQMEWARTLGAAHYIRILCEGRGDQQHREAMGNMLNNLSDQTRRATLVTAFNEGYLDRETAFPECTQEARRLEQSDLNILSQFASRN
jgi:uncharacterized protein (TIGR02301 family)